MNYDVSSIEKMEGIEPIRKNPGMFVGDIRNPTRILEEVLDNALDEVQAGQCTKIFVEINNEEGYFKIIDNGRGFPFDQSRDINEDPPILSSISLFTSGKFKKGKDDAYQISTGLHGVGMSCVYALSNKMYISSCRDKLQGDYILYRDGTIKRTQTPYEGNRKYSTSITVYPSEQDFKTTQIDKSTIEERLRIAVANYKNLKIMLVYDGEKQVISGTEDELILEYLGKEIENWIHISSIDKIESCNVKIGWSDTPPITPKVLSTVNLIRVHEGAHVNKIYNILKSVISKYAKKHKYNFQPEDCLSYIRLYINLKIIETSFEAQVKVKLGESSNLKIMDSIEKKLDDHFKNNPQFTKKVLEKFESYRKSLESKKAGINKSTKKKRGSTSFTKLKDCTGTNGELIIGEGDSAIGGLVSVRDIKKHALLPLMGVIPNAVTKKNLLQNAEIKDIILALGCGIDKQFDIEKLRYSKIIIAADADPAGHWITALLIILFAKMTPQLIKEGKLYVCKTPLFGYGYGKNFIPLWDDDEVKKARDEGKEIRRFKGLGEFDSTELKRFIMDEKTRELEQVTWSENVNALFRLMSSSEKRRELVNGTWSLDNG